MGRGRYRPQDRWEEQGEEFSSADYDAYEYEPEYDPAPRRKPQLDQRSRARRRRKRRLWPVLLAGCGLGFFMTVLAAALVVFLAFRASQGNGVGIPAIGGSTQTFSKEESQQISLTTIEQLLVCDKIGNVSIKVDQNATTASITTKKLVSQTSKSEAEQEFQRIGVVVQPPGTGSSAQDCAQARTTTSPSSDTPPAGNPDRSLLVAVNFPNPNSNSFVRNTTDSVDVAITLPPGVLPTDGPKMQLDVEAPVGNITVDGLSGKLTIRGSTGNVAVNHAILVDGSQIETGQGNVTFNGLLLAPPNSKTPMQYKLLSEQGNIDVTLPGDTNVTLDTNTNVGTIHSDFAIPLKEDGATGSASYRGPLNTSASATSQPSAVLLVDVSSGNVQIHKA